MPPGIRVHKSIASRLGAFRPNGNMSSVANARAQLRAANAALKASRRELCQLHKNGAPRGGPGTAQPSAMSWNTGHCSSYLRSEWDERRRCFAICVLQEKTFAPTGLRGAW